MRNDDRETASATEITSLKSFTAVAKAGFLE
jgi:hypothetical protein